MHVMTLLPSLEAGHLRQSEGGEEAREALQVEGKMQQSFSEKLINFAAMHSASTSSSISALPDSSIDPVMAVTRYTDECLHALQRVGAGASVVRFSEVRQNDSSN